MASWTLHGRAYNKMAVVATDMVLCSHRSCQHTPHNPRLEIMNIGDNLDSDI